MTLSNPWCLCGQSVPRGPRPVWIQSPGAFLWEGRCVAWLEDSLLKGRIGAALKCIFRKAPDVSLPGRRILERVTSHIESDNLGWLGPDAG